MTVRLGCALLTWLAVAAQGSLLRRSSLAEKSLEEFAQIPNPLSCRPPCRPSESPLFPVELGINLDLHTPPWEGVRLDVDPVTKHLRVEAGVNPANAVAWSRFADELSETGWTQLIVETSDSARTSNDMKMYGAGFVEGILTAARTSQFYSNFWQILGKDANGAGALVNIHNVVYKEISYIKKMTNLDKGIGSAAPEDSYWKQVRYLFIQLWGLKDGYNAVAEKKQTRKLEMADMFLINMHAELPELMEAYQPAAMDKRKAFQAQTARRVGLLQKAAKEVRNTSISVGRHQVNVSAEELREADRDWELRLARRGHCSALVRVGPESRDLFVGHTTWSDYGKMTRVFKYYNFKLPGAGTAASLIGMSSYPGCVSSTDNFYMMDSGLVTMDTSLEVLNTDLYNRLPEFPANPHVPNFLHVMAVNRVSNTGLDWTTNFASRNAGVPSSQWLVVDYNQFVPGASVRDNTLRLLEQMPGITHQADISQLLYSQGYWGAYNRPYFEQVREGSGHKAAEAKYGSLFSFADGPRATIFKHVAGSINGMVDMRVVMNRNLFPMEGVQPISPGHAISARLDLDQANRLPNGGIDAKVVDKCLFRMLQCQAISGPSHDNQPVFKWRDGNGVNIFPGWPHLGMPDVWNFAWVQMTPSKLLRATDEHVC